PVSEPPRPAGPPERARDAGGAERPRPVGPPAPAGPARPSPLAGGPPISGPPHPTAPPTERRDGGSAPSGPRPGGPADPQNRPGTMGITPAPAAPAPRERPMPPSRPGSEPPKSSAPAKVGEGTSKKRVEWKLPNIDKMLETKSRLSVSDEELRRRAEQIEQTLSSFGAPGRVVEVNHGPVITQFGVEPDYVDGRAGKRIKVKVAKISSLADDLALSLEAPTIRIEAPVPGKGYVGIEVPNEQPSIVGLKDVIDTPEFRNMKTPLRMALGQDVSGQPVVADLTSMPHLLIAGTTGSGKSVCVNGIIATMLMTSTPDQL